MMLLLLVALECGEVNVTAGRDMYIWQSRKQLECFCKQRPFFRDCRNLEDKRYRGDAPLKK
jgi:hypothetical protein